MDRRIIRTLITLAAEIDAREYYTQNHSKKVCEYATNIARALGYSRDERDRIRTSALLHDIGKIGLATSERLLNMGDTEWDRIHAHPYIGVVMLRYTKGLEECIPAIHYHHEHYDGTGYPDQLKGEDIPLDARVLAVADTYDAMTSPRPYRRAHSLEEAVEYIAQSAGSHFDPRVANAFLSISSPELVCVQASDIAH
jgi:putative nucleotidyltransferase with HDIG domain